MGLGIEHGCGSRREGGRVGFNLELENSSHDLFLGAGAELEGETRRYHAIQSIPYMSDTGSIHMPAGCHDLGSPSTPSRSLFLGYTPPPSLRCKYQIDPTPPFQYHRTKEAQRKRRPSPIPPFPTHLGWLHSQRTSVPKYVDGHPEDGDDDLFPGFAMWERTGIIHIVRDVKHPRLSCWCAARAPLPSRCPRSDPGLLLPSRLAMGRV